MKMTWKKKSGKKRVAIPNLPFEDDEEQETHSNLPSSLNSHSNNQPQQSNQTLADAFVQQGNNLAEVITNFSSQIATILSYHVLTK